MDHLKGNAVAEWVKRYHAASRATMDTCLRPYGLGSTQWYVLWKLANNGPTVQRDFLDLLQVEKATLSQVIGALVQKGFVEQTPASEDQRQRMLTITPAGHRLWKELPDPIELILKHSFDGVGEADMATVVRVLQGATKRLTYRLTQGSK
ncbi:MarR family winged helix-turn-helix transcriptional regulator [Pseudoduganella umbonata]|uniref:DNA-binding MarR family transcriptional regulator n=2 Tax=Pseudoduganella umbonata TaxID=864828 RepID=A0A7W5EAM1_9BURK|nr:MarR family transcriptional regulator [Pseudoduganella umbonata]MBB3221601.1 DNA-binding MarR family transcriptional regulator [Pseudoduganella umbonata]